MVKRIRMAASRTEALLLAAAAAGWALATMIAGPVWATPPAPPTRPAPATYPAAELGADPLPPGAIARLGAAWFHHPSPVAMLAVSGDGKMLATGCGDHKVRLWDIATGRETGVLDLVDNESAQTLEFVPGAAGGPGGQGGNLLVGTSMMRLALYDLAKRTRRWVLEIDSTGVIIRARVSPDGTRVGLLRLQPGKSCTLVVHDAGDGSIKYRGTAPGEALKDLAFINGGKEIVAGGDMKIRGAGPPTDGLFRWDAATGKPLAPLKGTEPRPQLLVANPQGTLLLVHAGIGSITVHDALTGEALCGLGGARSRLSAPAVFSRDGKLVVIGLTDRWQMFDPVKGHELSVLGNLAGQGTAAFLPEDRGVLLAQGPTIRVFDPATGADLHPSWGHGGAVDVLAVAPDGRWLASGGLDRVVRLWDLGSGRCVAARGQAVAAPLAFTADSKTLLWCPQPNTVQWLDVAAAQAGRAPLYLATAATQPGPEVQREMDLGAAATMLAVSRDGRMLLAAGTGANWQTLDLASPTAVLAAVGLPAAPWPEARALAPDLTRGARRVLRPDDKGSLVRTMQVLDLPPPGPPVGPGAGGAVLTARVAQEFPLRWEGGAAFSPDARWLLLPTAKSLQVWEVASGQMLAEVATGGEPTASAWSPRLRLVAWAGADGQVHLYDLAQGQELARFAGHRGGVSSLLFHADPEVRGGDRMTLVSGGQDTTIIIWDLQPVLRKLAAQPPAALTEAGAQAAWADLGAAGPAKAWAAFWRLADGGEAAAALLLARIEPAANDDALTKRIGQWITQLDDAEFERRSAAYQELVAAGPAAEAALRQALETTASEEVREKTRLLLADIAGRAPRVPPAQAGALRGLAVLEQVGSDQALARLQALAGGDPGSRLTREAKAALARLKPAGKQGINEH